MSHTIQPNVQFQHSSFSNKYRLACEVCHAYSPWQTSPAPSLHKPIGAHAGCHSHRIIEGIHPPLALTVLDIECVTAVVLHFLPNIHATTKPSAWSNARARPAPPPTQKQGTARQSSLWSHAASALSFIISRGVKSVHSTRN